MARGHESWYTQYIYDAFLMIYLRIFVAVLLFYHVLMIQRTSSEIRKGFNSVSLREGSSYITKWAAIEKKPSTLGKDKEDQNI